MAGPQVAEEADLTAFTSSRLVWAPFLRKGPVIYVRFRSLTSFLTRGSGAILFFSPFTSELTYCSVNSVIPSFRSVIMIRGSEGRRSEGVSKGIARNIFGVEEQVVEATPCIIYYASHLFVHLLSVRQLLVISTFLTWTTRPCTASTAFHCSAIAYITQSIW